MIEKRRFGRAGHMGTVTMFGAAALENVSQDDADRALELPLPTLTDGPPPTDGSPTP